MANFCIDIGNTLTKVAMFQNMQMTDFRVIERNNEVSIPDLLDIQHSDSAIISSVSVLPAELITSLQSKLNKVIVLDHNTPLPIENLYETRETLGKDRLAAVAGAHYLYPHDDLLVIDAGTAITYDLINRQGQYLGGNIAPGITMRYNALHHFTGKLPLLGPVAQAPAFGKNTTDAITAGVQQGILLEVDGTILHFKQYFPDLKVLFTGGDTKYFVNKLKNAIFVVSNLVMIGLNRILINNVKD